LSGGGGGKGGPLLRKWLLGSLPLVVQNGEELQTYFLGEVVEKAALFSGSGSWDPLGTLDFGQEEHNQDPVLCFQRER
jgi:hypothetical protein